MTMPESEDSRTDGPPAKRLKLDESPQASTSSKGSTSSKENTSSKESTSSKGSPSSKETIASETPTELLNFCDDLILEILSYVKPIDLLAVSETCQRLQRVVFDRTLWINVDFRTTCISGQRLQKYVKFFLPTTRMIATKGPWTEPEPVEREGERQLIVPIPESKERSTISGDLLESISKAAVNLKTLILENHVLDSQELTWDKVPSTVEHLSLRSCHVTKLDSTKSLFFGIDRFLPNVKTLDLSQCRWFQSHSFLALSKCKELQELRLADCLLSDFVPYVSLGTRFGFKALTVVDFRRTWVSDREVSCLNKVPSLRELYLESPGGERGASMISDLAVTAFGATLDEWNQMGFIVVLMPHFEGFMPSPLRVIQMSNYRTVTDTSLRHCASCLKGLRHINVTGTSVTLSGVIKFKCQRPDVVIKSDYDVELGGGSRSIPSSPTDTGWF